MSDDLRTLMQRHAPQPSEEPDLARITAGAARRRARRRTRQRWTFAAVPASIGVAIAIVLLPFGSPFGSQPARVLAVSYSSQTLQSCPVARDDDSRVVSRTVEQYETTVGAVREWWGGIAPDLGATTPMSEWETATADTPLTVCLQEGIPVQVTTVDGEQSVHVTNSIAIVGEDAAVVVMGQFDSPFDFQGGDLPQPAS